MLGQFKRTYFLNYNVLSVVLNDKFPWNSRAAHVPKVDTKMSQFRELRNTLADGWVHSESESESYPRLTKMKI